MVRKRFANKKVSSLAGAAALVLISVLAVALPSSGSSLPQGPSAAGTVPNPPVDVAASWNSNGAVVTWAHGPPSGSGGTTGASPSTYTATATDLTNPLSPTSLARCQGTDPTEGGATATCTITGLDSIDVYSIAVIAENSAGASAPSAPVQVSALGFPQLAAYWPFDSASNYLTDSVTGLDMQAMQGSPTWSADGVDGTGQVSLANGSYLLYDGGAAVPNSILPTGGVPYTLSSWFKTTTSGNLGMVAWGSYGNYDQVNALRTDGCGQLDNYWWSNDLDVSSGINFCDGHWHLATVTFDGTIRTLYIDGQEIGTDEPGTPASSNQDFTIGATFVAFGEEFQGSLSDVAIYDGALSAQQVVAIYQTALPQPPTDITATAEDGGAFVQWRAKANSASPTSYVVTATDTTNPSNPTASCTDVVADNSNNDCALTGLVDGDTYAVSVTAMAGGAASAPSSSTTVTPSLGIPAGLMWSSDGTSITITGFMNPTATSVDIPGQIDQLPVAGVAPGAFQGLNNLTTLELPASLTTVGTGAFADDPALATVTFDGSAPTLQAPLFGGDSSVAVEYNGLNSGWYPWPGALSGTTAVNEAPRVVPNPPSQLTAIPGANSVTISWSPSDGYGWPVTAYTLNAVNQQTGAAFPVPCTTTGATSCTFTGLTNGSSYSFTVTATNAVGTSSPSAPVVATPVSVPSAPTGVTARPGSESAVVSWSAAGANGSAITGYVVTATDASNAASQTNGATCSTAGSTSCVVSGLTDGDAYTFRVAASNAIAAGPSSASSAPVVPGSAPDAPSNIHASIAGGKVNVIWSPPATHGSAITSYQVTVLDATSPSSSTNGTTCTTQSTTSCSFSNLAVGDTYTFMVRATNGFGPGLSGTSNAVAVAGIPGAPSNVSATAQNQAAVVSWLAPSSGGSTITSYQVTAIDISNAASPTSGATCSTAGWTSCTVSGLTDGDSYRFTVAATNGVGTGATSTPSTPVVPGAVPGAPSNVIATSGAASANVVWSPPPANGSPIMGYLATATDLSNQSDGTNGLTCSTTTKTSCTISGLNDGDTYSFSVVATNGFGLGASSDSNPVTPADVPATPAISSLSAGNSTVIVGWTAPASKGSPITTYQVTATDVSNAASPTQGQSCTSVSTSCTFTGLTNGDSYRFVLVATNSVGSSLPSLASSLATPGQPPEAPTNVSASAASSGAAIVWSPPPSNGSAVTGYVVVATDLSDQASPTDGASCATTTATACTVTGLTDGDSYSFTVTGSNGFGPGTPSAPSQGVTPASVPGAPASFVVVPVDQGATATWEVPASNGSPITGYLVTASDVSNATSPTNGTTCISESSPTCTFDRLVNGDTYSFTVVAQNALGSSSSSTPVTGVVPSGVPGSPTNVSSRISGSSVNVVWSPPADNGAPITGYSVVATDTSNAESPTNGATCDTLGATLCTFTTLDAGDTYTFSVVARNVNGPGNAGVASRSATLGAGRGHYGASPNRTAPASIPAPINLGGSAGNQQVMLEWTADTAVGEQVSGYTVTAQDVTNEGSSTNGLTCTTSRTTSCAVVGLTNGDGYTFTVTATSNLGTSPASIPTLVLTPVAAPAAPGTTSARPGNGQATILWAPASPNGAAIIGYVATAHDLSHSTSSTNGATCATQGTTSCTIARLTNGDTYDFTVVAQNSIGSSPMSVPTSQVTPGGSPAAPTGVTGRAGNQEVQVSWNAASNNGSPITNYVVTAEDLSNEGSSTNGTTCPTNGSTTCTLSGLTNGESYAFTVEATNERGTSQASAPSASLAPGGPPGEPTNVAVRIGNGQVAVVWSPPSTNGSPISLYSVTATDLSNGASATNGATCTTATGTTCTITGLTNGDAYSFSVVAHNGFGASSSSAPSTGVTPAGLPSAPSAVIGQAGNGQANIQWTAASSNGSPIANYTVVAEDLTDEGGATNGATCTTSTTACTFNGLVNGDSYVFRVTATNGIGTSPSSQLSAAVVPASLPLRPTNVAAQAGSHNAIIVWSPPSSNGSPISLYTATATDLSNGASATNGASCTTATGTTCTITGLTNGDRYTFSVIATNGIGPGPASDPSSAVTPAGAPGTPQNLTIADGDGSVDASWDVPSSNGSPIANYTVVAEDLTDEGGATNGATCTTSTTACTFNGLVNGDSYVFRVTATNGIGTSPSSQLSAAVVPSGLPSTPVQVTVHPGNGRIVVGWGPSTGNGSPISSYTATATDLSDPSSATNETTCIVSNGTTCTIDALTNGDSYDISVVATNAAGAGNASAALGSVTPESSIGGVVLGVPSAPPRVAATAGHGSVAVSWFAADANGTPVTRYLVTATDETNYASPTTGATCSTAGSTSCSVSGLVDGDDYSFVVTATNAIGTSSPSESSTPVVPTGPPGMPTHIAATPGNRSAAIQWSPSAANGSPISFYTATSTDLTNPSSPTSGLTCTALGTSCTITGLTNGDSYTFIVSATSAVGTTTAASGSASVVPGMIPAAPALGAVHAGNGTISVSWSPGSDGGSPILRYDAVVEDVTNEGGRTNGTTCTAQHGTSCTITGLTNGDTYVVTVTATNAIGTSQASGRSAHTVPFGPPTAPTNVGVRPGDKELTVVWSPSNPEGSSITSYVVQVSSSSPAGPFSPLCTTQGATKCTISALGNGTSYYVKVSAVNGAGPSVASSTVGPSIPAGAPSAPASVTATAGNGTASIAWAPADANGSPITTYTATATDLSNQASQTSSTTCQSSGALSCSIAGLINGDAYTFSVTASNAVGQSAASASSAAVVPAGPPGIPTNVAAIQKVGSISVAWSPPADDGSPISSYVVSATDLTTRTTTPWVCVVSATICTVSGLKEGNSYAFNVAALNAVGSSSSSVASNEVVFAGVPSAPSNVVVSQNGSSVTVSWSPPAANGSPMTGYAVSDGIGDTCTTATKLSCTLTGLNEGSSYRFNVTASNALGQGPPGASAPIIFGTQSAATFGSSDGATCNSCSVTLEGSGFKPGSMAQVVLHSTPTTLGTFVVPESGSFSVTEHLPGAVDPGTHTIILEGYAKSGAPMTETWFLKLASGDVITAETPGPPVAAPPWPLATPLSAIGSWTASVPATSAVMIGGTVLPAFNPLTHTRSLQTTLLGAAALLAIGGAAGAAAAAGAGSLLGGNQGFSNVFTVEVGQVAFDKHVGMDNFERKERPWTWRLPFTDSIIENFPAAAHRVSPYSPFLARVLNGGAYLRALFGPLSLLTIVLGAIIGIACGLNVHGSPLPPAWPLFAAAAALGVIDVLAGLVAGLCYTTIVIASGGWGTLAGVRTCLGIMAAFVAIIFAVNALRPLSRPPAQTFTEWFDRTADAVVAILVAMFMTSSILLTIQEFAGARVPLINDAFAIMLIVGLATLVRYGGETLATHVHLREMVLAQGQPPGAQRESFRIISAILGAGVFLFCAVPYVGWAWPLWIAGGVTLARTLVVGFQHYLPASRFKHLAPRGLLNFLVMIGVGILLTHLLRDHIHSSHQLVVISTVVIVLPGLLFELARAVTRNREEIPMTWAIRAAGAFAVAATVVLCVATGLVFT